MPQPAGTGLDRSTSEDTLEVAATEIKAVREFIAEVRRKRITWEVRSYVNMMMKEGHHDVNDMGELSRPDAAKLRRAVNKFRIGLRKMKNSILFNDPIVDVLPERGNEFAAKQEEVDAASFVVLREWKKNKMKKKMKTVIDNALTKTWCVMSIMPNNDDEDDRLTVFKVYDSMDVYFSDHDFDVAQRIVISAHESKDRLKAMGYDPEEVDKGDQSSNMSHSMYKDRFERMNNKGSNPDMLLIDQVFEVRYRKSAADKDDNDADDEGEFDYDDPYVVSFTLVGDEILPLSVEGEDGDEYKEIHEVEDATKLSDIFLIYYAEHDEHNAYSSPWMTDVVPLQRSLNDASEDIDTILNSTAKVRVIQKKGDNHTVQMLEDRHLQKIAYEGSPPEFAKMQNPPEALFNVIAMRREQIEDIIGQHAPSLGSLDPNVTSGRQQALVMAADMDNLSEPIDNLEELLEEIFSRVLKIAEKNIREVIKIYGETPEKSMVVIGADAQDSAKEDPNLDEADESGMPKPSQATAIRSFNNISVRVIPGNLFTVQQAKSEFLELLPLMSNMGMEIEAKAMWRIFMRMMAVGATRDISRLVEKEQSRLEGEDPEKKIAEMEVMMMAKGRRVMATPFQDHNLHLAIKMPVAENYAKEFGRDNQLFLIIMQNIAEHESFMQAKQGNPKNKRRGNRPTPEDLTQEVA